MVSSGVWAGKIPLEKAHSLQEVGGGKQTMKQELERIGYLGAMESSFSAMPIAAHFELHIGEENCRYLFNISIAIRLDNATQSVVHWFWLLNFDVPRFGGLIGGIIEQGPRLESQEQKIGVVRGVSREPVSKIANQPIDSLHVKVQAYRWHTVTVIGRECHTGTTDFANRSDAMLTAAKMILHSHRLATKYSCLASTGMLTLSPGSTNTVPGTARFSLDIRAGEDDRLMKLEHELKVDFEKIAKNEAVDDLNEGGTIGRACTVEWTLDAPSEAIKFDEDCIRCVYESAKELFGDEHEKLTQAMISGAGHDSVFCSKVVPTSMIFVPCRNGVSHNPAEYCSIEDCRNGAQVLMGAVLRYDMLRAQQSKS
ncbi:MAG: hypothetical protein ALECFALPRED_002746 [Alectoria fallacina]|uniref:Peptidase M20 dimerisation domain-containing protein n=1 Tax=Alectoria fallacina TaxID=1903189 RepID=A0A8H3I863_9LECA|nr:MAG: hypothetical protein ALECFALPRED_002746 [Alectoria fallacina]